jgi:HAD superfamily hydrolase (TIGR01509 family)
MKVKGLTSEINGIIFDMDGLLVNTEKLYWQANVQAAHEEGLSIPDDAYLALNGASVAQSQAFFEKYFPTQEKRDTFIKRTDDLVWQWAEEGRIRLMPGVAKALAQFKDWGLKMGIASSNYARVIKHNLTLTHVSDYFDFILSDVDLEGQNVKPKPAGDIYRLAAQKSGLPNDQLLVFEDSSNGIAAATDAGLQSVMIPCLKQPTDLDRQRASLICASFNNFLDLAKK